MKLLNEINLKLNKAAVQYDFGNQRILSYVMFFM